MKKIAKLISIITAVMLLMTACKGTGGQSEWQEQFDLGIRFLNEDNYNEAIIAFEAAIEIEPKNPRAYIGLADVYIKLGDKDKAKEVLEKGLENIPGNEEIIIRIDGLNDADTTTVTTTQPETTAAPIVTEIPDSEKYIFTFIEELNTPIPFTTSCWTEGYDTTGTIEFKDYSEFESADGFEAAEGYEWRAVTVILDFYDENWQNYGWLTGYGLNDYYYFDEDEDVDFEEDEEFTINYNGEDYTKCKSERTNIRSDNKGMEVRVSIRVPIGYDGFGLAVYDRDAGVKMENGARFIDAANENTVFFRLKK